MQRKKFYAREFILGLLTAATITGAPAAYARSRGHASPQPTPSGSPGTIHGTCSVVASATNPFAGPCVNLSIILNDAQGVEKERGRTNAQGQFEFDATSGQDYRVVPGSKYYDIVSPTTAVHAGDKVDLKLQQK